MADGLGFQAFTRWWAEQVIRVLKPGGYVAAFGAPRTVHRLVAGFEDAGLEIRDQLLWCFGTALPKSRRMPGGLGSALKPAYEPIVLARKPLDPPAKTIAANLEQHGTGALNIDAARIARSDSDAGAEGYWPANVALSHDRECDERRGDCVVDCVVPLIDRIAAGQQGPGAPPFSRLFYAAKASRAEREAGEGLPKGQSPIFSGRLTAPRANSHPTVKPIALMRWLLRLVVSPGGVVLDPFAGSGSTGIAAVAGGTPVRRHRARGRVRSHRASSDHALRRADRPEGRLVSYGRLGRGAWMASRGAGRTENGLSRSPSLPSNP